MAAYLLIGNLGSFVGQVAVTMAAGNECDPQSALVVWVLHSASLDRSRGQCGPAGIPVLPASATATGRAGAVTAAPEDYLGRLVKYIPAEIVALYLGVAGVIPRGPDGRPDFRALWIVFLVIFVLVLVYFYFATRREGKPTLWSQVLLATIAFPVWVFAIGGPFESLGWYRSWIASVFLMFVTFVFGLYKPAPEG